MHPQQETGPTRPGLAIGAMLRATFILFSLSVVGVGWAGRAVDLMDHPVSVAAVILLLGVPHGAFDVALARNRWDLGTSGRTLVFLAAYVGLAGAVLFVWRLAPGLALPSFLLVSGFHFAGDWQRQLAFLPRLIVGTAIIAAPAVFHSAEVVEIFSWIVPGPVAGTVSNVMASMAIPLLASATLILAAVTRSDPLAALEASAVMVLALCVEPLAFFVIYFCGLHSVRHVVGVRKELSGPSLSEFFALSLPYAPLAIMGTLCGGWVVTWYGLDPASLGVVFLALAALTAPPYGARRPAPTESPSGAESIALRHRPLRQPNCGPNATARQSRWGYPWASFIPNAFSSRKKAAVVEAAFFRREGAGLLAGNGYFGIRTVSMTWATPFD